MLFFCTNFVIYVYFMTFINIFFFTCDLQTLVFFTDKKRKLQGFVCMKKEASATKATEGLWLVLREVQLKCTNCT